MAVTVTNMNKDIKVNFPDVRYLEANKDVLRRMRARTERDAFMVENERPTLKLEI